MLRLLIILVTLVAVERAANACCLGCACTKYKQQQDQDSTVQLPAVGYTHSVRGAVPRWSIDRITKFLTSGTWLPVTPKPPKVEVPREGAQRTTYVPPPPLLFVAADQIKPAFGRELRILVRRIEKQGSAILVEVNDRTFKLAPCAGKRGYTCLVDPGKLQLAPIPPPGDPAVDRFAKPPP